MRAERLDHILVAAGVGEAHEPAALRRIEVAARRRRDMRLGEHAAGERHAVIGQLRHIAKGVERAIHGGRKRKAEFGQATHQQGAVLGVAGLYRSSSMLAPNASQAAICDSSGGEM